MAAYVADFPQRLLVGDAVCRTAREFWHFDNEDVVLLTPVWITTAVLNLLYL